jgi:hypothetical protein
MRKGQKNTLETIAKMRTAQLGHLVSNETKEKLRVGSLGRHPSAENLAKRSASLKGRIFSNDTKRKISISKTGTKNAQWGTHRSKDERQYLSRILSGTRTGSANPAWKGGVRIDGNGYETVRVHEHFYLLTHRLIMERILGRKLQGEEVVHHVNRNRKDNRPENLALCNNASAHGWCATEEAKMFFGGA